MMVLTPTAYFLLLFYLVLAVQEREQLFLKDSIPIFLDSADGITYPGLQHNFSLQDQYNLSYYQALVFYNLPYVKPIVPDKSFSETEMLDTEDYKKLVLNREYGKFGHYCPQFEDDKNYEKRRSMDLDCLNLNVFAPPLKENVLYPVYVLIHGGKLVHGSSIDLGVDGIVKNFVSKGVVVVTPNYRLGIWGFYNFKGNKTGHSARGLYDKLNALKWVNKYIGGFGGDNKRVTIGGYSAGACAVAVLTLVALANPEYQLFNNVILHSGYHQTCIAGGVFSQNYEEPLAKLTAAYFGLQYNAPDSIFKTRKEMLDDASKAQTKQPLNILMGTVLHEFVNFDGLIKNLTNKPYGPAYMREAFDRIVLIGTGTENILSLILNEKNTQINILHEQMISALEKLLDIYFMGLDEDESDDVGNFRVCTKMLKDYWMTSNMVNDARFFTKSGHNVTLYKFVHVGPLPSKYKHTTPLMERSMKEPLESIFKEGNLISSEFSPKNEYRSSFVNRKARCHSERFVSTPKEDELKRHKLKGLVQHPNSFFMDLKCPGCTKITTTFSHASTVVSCVGCGTVLCQPTGGKARLVEGCKFRKKPY